MPTSVMSLVYQLSASPVTPVRCMQRPLSHIFMGSEAIDTDPSKCAALAEDKECHPSVVSATKINLIKY